MAEVTFFVLIGISILTIIRSRAFLWKLTMTEEILDRNLVAGGMGSLRDWKRFADAFRSDLLGPDAETL